MKTTVLEFLFNNKRLQHNCFLVKFEKFLRTHFLQNNSGGCFHKFKKSTTLESEGLKIETKRLNMKKTQVFHFTEPFQTVFTCPNSIIKTEKHCAEYVQSETKNKFCKIKCVKQNFYKCVHFLLFLLLPTL